MERKDVFISYKSEEFDEASWVKATLEHNGISCWMAPMCIPGGSSYAVEIPAAIKQCKVFVLILSERSQLSQWVPKELDQAINEAKVIMPFMLENCRLQDDFNFYLTNVQRYEAYRSKAATMERMIREIKALLQKNGEGEKAEQTEEKQESPADNTSKPKEKAELPADHAPQPEEKLERPAEESQQPAQPEKSAKKKKAPKEKKQKATPSGKKKKLTALWILLGVVLVIGLIIGISAGVKRGNEITVAGTVFEKDTYYLHLEGKTLTNADMEKLTEFERIARIELINCTVNAVNLSNITAHDLYALVIRGCQLTDTQLQTLNFEGLENMYELDLSDNPKLTDLSMLAPLSDSMHTLDIGGTGISDINMLESFTELHTLGVRGLGLTELKALTGMIYLEYLYASDNRLESLEGLENITLLKTVDLSNNAIGDVSLLSKSVATLKQLYLDSNALTNLDCLATCTGLVDVSVNNNQLETLSWLGSCSELLSLSANHNQITDVVGLSVCKNLNKLDLAHNRLTEIMRSDLSFQEEGYVTVDLSGNQLVSCLLPTNCYYSELKLQGNAFTDMAVLQGLEGGKVCFTYPQRLGPESLNDIGIYNCYIIDCPLDQRVAVQKVLSSVYFVTEEEAMENFQ